MGRLAKPLLSLKKKNKASVSEQRGILQQLLQAVAKQRSMSQRIVAGQHSLARSLEHRLNNILSGIMKNSALVN